MAGKFLRRGAIIDTIKSEQRTNAIQRQSGLLQHPITVTSCGCPDPNCGAWHTIRTERTIPSTEECRTLLSKDSRARKPARPRRRA